MLRKIEHLGVTGVGGRCDKVSLLFSIEFRQAGTQWMHGHDLPRILRAHRVLASHSARSLGQEVLIMRAQPGGRFEHGYYLYDGKNHFGLRQYWAADIKNLFVKGELRFIQGSVPHA